MREANALPIQTDSEQTPTTDAKRAHFESEFLPLAAYCVGNSPKNSEKDLMKNWAWNLRRAPISFCRG
jgi:hypothetical protein